MHQKNVLICPDLARTLSSPSAVPAGYSFGIGYRLREKKYFILLLNITRNELLYSV